MIELLQEHILAVLLIWPIIGAGLVLLSRPASNGGSNGWKGAKLVALFVTLTEFVLSLNVFLQFDPYASMSFKQSYSPGFLPVNLSFGVDGISLWLILLCTFLMPLVVLSSWNQVKKQVRGYLISVLVIETAVIGALVSLNLIVFYVFWEAMIVPMFLIIGIWGSGRRIYSAIKFFLFTGLGSLLMLVAMIYLYAQTGTVDLPELLTNFSFSDTEQFWCFLAFGLAFGVKIPVVPVHTWLPDAHTDAPTGGSVILAGILLKLGAFGFMRFAIPLFPAGFEAFQYVLILLGLIGILYGAILCLVQTDVKRLIAYSSISHLGFVVFGLAAFGEQATAGALFVMVSHGLTTGGLFLLIGMLYERRHTRDLNEFGGLASSMPGFGFLLVFTGLASVGLPGLSGFAGEFLVLLGAFNLESSFYAFTATIGIILAAWYMLRLLKHTLFGPVDQPENRQVSDLNLREWVTITPVVIFIVVLGLYPMFLIGPSESSLEDLRKRFVPEQKNAKQINSHRSVQRTTTSIRRGDQQ